MASWYDECRRRHAVDVDAVRVVEKLHKLSSANQRRPAEQQLHWKRLLEHGEEAMMRLCALCTEDAWLAADPSRRATAERAVVALNQSVVRREWVALLAATREADAPPPAIEEGALLLVRLYMTADQLANESQACVRLGDPDLPCKASVPCRWTLRESRAAQRYAMNSRGVRVDVVTAQDIDLAFCCCLFASCYTT